jgi:hypothetical protein
LAKKSLQSQAFFFLFFKVFAFPDAVPGLFFFLLLANQAISPPSTFEGRP